jgi:hypothetical protein
MPEPPVLPRTTSLCGCGGRLAPSIDFYGSSPSAPSASIDPLEVVRRTLALLRRRTLADGLLLWYATISIDI